MILKKVPHPDVLIAGAGIIGLSLALELHTRGAQVTVLERDAAYTQASYAAAGMLAAEDPHNPPALSSISQRSLAIYPDYLARVSLLSGFDVPFQTSITNQYVSGNVRQRLNEQSLDPRQLGDALLAAVRSTSIDFREHVGELELADDAELIHVRDAYGDELSAPYLVHATGAWFRPRNLVQPRKGQMLRVRYEGLEVHRSEQVYIVPRTAGPQAGTALIGATVETTGFDVTTDAASLARLQQLAAGLVPEIANAPIVESWAGLRPATSDQLPLLGPLPFSPREIAATGHFRNGILLAPITAVLIADILEGKSAEALAPFLPSRFD